jgi:MSHA biogenesis protein MshO
MRVFPKQRGVSLLELIIVIVLLGVLTSGAGLLITKPIQAYTDQLRRQQLVDQAEMALRQIARDIRRALPNSLRIEPNPVTGGWALEMTNTIDGARDRDEQGGAFTTAADTLDFSSADTDFNLLGNFDTLIAKEGQRLAIYNTEADNFYNNVIAVGGAGVVTPSTSEITLTFNGIEQHININPGFQFSQQSPGQRIFLIDGPISYICDPSVGQTNMVRYSNYAFQSTQPTTAATFAALTSPPTPAFLSGDVVTKASTCDIVYDSGSAKRGGIITISLTLADPTGESITLLHQVHVLNAP